MKLWSEVSPHPNRSFHSRSTLPPLQAPPREGRNVMAPHSRGVRRARGFAKVTLHQNESTCAELDRRSSSGPKAGAGRAPPPAAHGGLHTLVSRGAVPRQTLLRRPGTHVHI